MARLYSRFKWLSTVMIAIGVLAVAFSALLLFRVLASERRLQSYAKPANAELRRQANEIVNSTTAADYKRAAGLLKQAADDGDVLAWTHWAVVQKAYLRAKMPVDEDARAGTLRMVQKLADSGNGEAAYIYSRYLLYVEPGRADDAFRYAQASAENYEPSWPYLALMYREGDGTTPDLDKAAEWYGRAVEKGNVSAIYRLAGLLSDPKNPKHNFARGYSLHLQAAQAGYGPAWYAVGWARQNGVGTKADPAGALKAYAQGAAAGDASSLYALGMAYYQGKAVAKNLAKAREYFEQAAALGNKDASEAVRYIDSPAAKKGS